MNQETRRSENRDETRNEGNGINGVNKEMKETRETRDQDDVGIKMKQGTRERNKNRKKMKQESR